MNKCLLIGRITKAPENKTTPNGISVTTFTVAVKRRSEGADFIPVVTWRGLADNCGKYLVKGQKVAVSGQIQTRSYDDQNGQKHYVTEIVADDVEFLNKPSGEHAERQRPNEPDDGLFAGMDDVELDDGELDSLPF